MDGLNELIDAVESKIDELEGSSIVESSTDIFSKVMNDPDVELSEPDEKGNQDVSCCGKKVGWLNPNSSEYELDESYIKSTRKITATKAIETESDLREAIYDVLDSDICAEIVKLAVAEDGTFEDDLFIEADEFYNTELANLDPKEVAEKFVEGIDLEENKSPANPKKAYLRFNEDDDIESTDYPGDVYYDLLRDDIVEYIMDHRDELEFPSYIQELIDEYFEEQE